MIFAITFRLNRGGIPDAPPTAGAENTFFPSGSLFIYLFIHLYIFFSCLFLRRFDELGSGNGATGPGGNLPPSVVPPEPLGSFGIQSQRASRSESIALRFATCESRTSA